MKTTTLAATAAVLLAASGAVLCGVFPALAQPGPDPVGDGVVTLAEAKARSDAMWLRLDVNKDGVLNAADRKAQLARVFDGFDTNHDGAVTRAEFMENQQAMMDGKVGMDGPHKGMGRGMGRGMMMGHGGGMMHDMGAMADTNQDKSISRAEFDAAGQAMFDKADANHDEKLTAAERRAKHGRNGGHGMHAMHGDMGGDVGAMPPPPGA